MQDTGYDIGPDGYPTDPGHPFNRAQTARSADEAVTLMAAVADAMILEDLAHVVESLDDVESDATQPAGWRWDGDYIVPARLMIGMRSLPPVALEQVKETIRFMYAARSAGQHP